MQPLESQEFPHVVPGSPKRRRRRRLLVLVLALHAPVLLLAVVPVPFSLMMLKGWLECWGDSQFDARYDWVSLDAISPQVQLAVIAAEDQKFPRHFGFDLEAIGKAWDYNQRSQRVRGASTISQQVAKNLFFPFGRSWVRKAIEAYWTCWIELLWPKQRILEVYLNIVELGPGTFGVEAASQRYFGHSAARLNASEAARLAAVLPNPREYSVQRPGAYVAGRAGWIRRQMSQLGLGYLKDVPVLPGWLDALVPVGPAKGRGGE